MTNITKTVFEVKFIDVQIDGDVRSWRTVLKTFSCGELVRHLAKRGLQLNCTEDARRPDSITCEDWDEDQGRGEIRLGSTKLIGRFVVKQISDAAAEPVGPRTNRRGGPSRSLAPAVVSDRGSYEDVDPSAWTATVTCGGYPCEIPF